MNFVEFTWIFLNFVEFAVFEKRLTETDPRTDGPTHGRRKPLTELLFATKKQSLPLDIFGWVLRSGARPPIAMFLLFLVVTIHEKSCKCVSDLVYRSRTSLSPRWFSKSKISWNKLEAQNRQAKTVLPNLTALCSYRSISNSEDVPRLAHLSAIIFY